MQDVIILFFLAGVTTVIMMRTKAAVTMKFEKGDDAENIDAQISVVVYRIASETTWRLEDLHESR